jgi:Putative DNA-binding domain
MSNLQARLTDTEDHLTERKLEGVGASEFKRAIVAFANSTPPENTGALFIGVGPNGDIQGVGNADKLQRTLRKLAEQECYPPINIHCEVLKDGYGKEVVAVEIPYSTSRPHFGGSAWVRKGSESVEASAEEYRRLLLSQDDKRRHLLNNHDKLWTLEFQSKNPGEAWSLRDPTARGRIDCRVEEVTAFYVRLRDVGTCRVFSEMLQDVHFSYDDKLARPRILVWPTDR